MLEKQNKENIFFFVVLLIIIGLFLVLNPKVSSTLFPIKRQMVLQTFINNTKQNNKIDSQKFWEFREFYSPGYFNFNKNGLTSSQIKAARDKSGVSINLKNIDRFFLTFTSPHLTSLEALVTTNKLTDVINTATFDSKSIIFSNNNTLIFKDKNIHIIFLKSESDMQRANGFFDYSEADKNLVNGKYWLEVTTIDEDLL